MTNAFRGTAERRNKRVWWSLSPTEMSAKRVSFRLIAPLYEKLTAYLANKWTFATPGPAPMDEDVAHGCVAVLAMPRTPRMRMVAKSLAARRGPPERGR